MKDAVWIKKLESEALGLRGGDMSRICKIICELSDEWAKTNDFAFEKECIFAIGRVKAHQKGLE